MKAIEEYFSADEIAEIKDITTKINLVQTKISEGLAEEVLITIRQEEAQLKERLEAIRLNCFKREYNKLSEEEQFDWWVAEFEKQIKARIGGEFVYKMFTKEQYDYWVKLDEDFDDLLLQLCMTFDFEYELAYTLCEHPQNSEMWKHVIAINEE